MKLATCMTLMILAIMTSGCCTTRPAEPPPDPQVVYVPVAAKIPAPPPIQEPQLVIKVADWNDSWTCQDFLMILMEDYAELYRWYRESVEVINEYKALANSQ